MLSATVVLHLQKLDLCVSFAAKTIFSDS